jgi:hypothetical protein
LQKFATAAEALPQLIIDPPVRTVPNAQKLSSPRN